MKIGIIIPSTSNGREWTTYKETYLYNHTIKSFLLIIHDTNKCPCLVPIRYYTHIHNYQTYIHT